MIRCDISNATKKFEIGANECSVYWIEEKHSWEAITRNLLDRINGFVEGRLDHAVQLHLSLRLSRRSL